MTSNRNRAARLLANAALGSSWPAILLLAFGCSSSDTNGGKSGLGTGGSGATDAAAGGSGGGATAGPEPVLPTLPAGATCPDLQTGTIQVQGKPVEVWVGARQADVKGPVLFYWHGTGSQAAEIQAFMSPMIAEIQSQGGIAASFTSTVDSGSPSGADAPRNTGNFVWYTDDYVSADIILACAVQQLNIDTHRIYAAGCSAGGLEAGSMVLARSSYLAAAMTNSGGNVLVFDWQDTGPDGKPTHVPSVMSTHGSYTADVVILHFMDWSRKLDRDVADLGGYAVDCTHPGGHCQAPAADVTAQWQFLKDHPFGVSTDPYADGLPSSFPSYCEKIVAGGGDK